MKLIPLLRFIVISIVLVVPFWSLVMPGMHPIQDDMQYFRVYEMTKCFMDGQLPCRWVPDMGYEYGYPLYIYYPPGPYYLGAVLHMIGVPLVTTIKQLFITGFVGSFWAMYVFLKNRFGSWPAIVGSVLYLYAPVRMVQVYVRGSLSEFLSFIFFPLILLGVDRIVKRGKIADTMLLALSTAGLLLTHNLMTLTFLPVVAVWVTIHVLLQRNWLALRKVLFGGILGVGLAAFFVLPLVIEKQYAHTESLIGGYFGYQQHFVNLAQLFSGNHFGYGSSQLGPNDDLYLGLGLHWVFAAIAGIWAIVAWRKNRSSVLAILSLLAVTVACIFLMHEKSSFIWTQLSFLAWLQFPWRLLVVCSFLLSLVAVWPLAQMAKKTAALWGRIMLLAVIVLYAGRFVPQTRAPLTDVDLLSGSQYEKQLTSSIFDYLPTTAVLPPNRRAPQLPEVLTGEAEVTNYHKGSDNQSGTITVTSETALIRLPLFDFPGMTVWADGQKVDHNHAACQNQDYCFGQISFTLPNGTHSVQVALQNTPVRSIGDIISVGSLVVVMGGFLWSKKSKS